MQLEDVSLQLGQQSVLRSINWQLENDQAWAVLGTNASGKTSLARVLTGELRPSLGTVVNRPQRVAWVSLENQQELYERELYRDDTDLMDQIDQGTSVRELLCEIAPWQEHHDQLSVTLQLSPLLARGYRLLSTGEGRRVMLARALLAKPDWLILDEPFEGLDKPSREHLHDVLSDLIASGQALILMVSQREDIVHGCSHLALLDKGRMLYQGEMPSDLERQWQHLFSLRRSVELPARQSEYQLPDWPAEQPLVRLHNGIVQYDNTYQFRDLNWALLPGQHTQITGPNGCGKSTLLNLITGDHPQCYRNDLSVLGFQRGQGESIWQIKKHMGYVSGNLHRDYRASGNALTAIISGLTDSIGLYQSVGDSEQALARHWLQLIGLHDKANVAFKSLSMGEQRLVLIARALIKQPPLIILDEPTQGLDDFNRFYVLEIIDRIISNGPSTLLFVSHRQDETPNCIRNRLMFTPDPADHCLFCVQQS